MDVRAFESHRSSVSTAWGDIAYVDMGEGPAALFIHGVFLNSSLWRHTIDELAPDRRCIAIDLLGHGATRAAPGVDVSMPAQAEMLSAFCDALTLDSIDLVGNDSGAAIAQILAARDPSRLRTLTLTNTDTHTNLPPEAFVPVVDIASQGGIPDLAQALLADLDLARSDLGLGVGFKHPNDVPDDALRSYLEPFANPDTARDLERFIVSMNAEHLTSIEGDLRRLDVPTLVVWGTGDQFFDVQWAYWLRDTIPGVTAVVELPGATLFFPEERAPELVEHLRMHWAIERREA
jgi:pimeloyl-ACP methyl ester carboxylesterase